MPSAPSAKLKYFLWHKRTRNVNFAGRRELTTKDSLTIPVTAKKGVNNSLQHVKTVYCSGTMLGIIVIFISHVGAHGVFSKSFHWCWEFRLIMTSPQVARLYSTYFITEFIPLFNRVFACSLSKPHYWLSDHEKTGEYDNKSTPFFCTKKKYIFKKSNQFHNTFKDIPKSDKSHYTFFVYLDLSLKEMGNYIYSFSYG